ncbi:hypothetical protein H696_00188 [Fonticula alba]|uniref:Clathrin/coatomer adaptor adaptin-like N-terminal domain-containing protein n=1 Tax=Fonticula alba TaxID=691883 RepID=A0A058ZE12_FONAL|nr:hypothetical protein H696_00188 [Fonticula alba]KCV72604.1 hypothetical protein H696_00188 [Fonticula alba]|eukprot:XP_009492305.1 hypothetical protein H696_00188 [Fonticula alba]
MSGRAMTLQDHSREVNQLRLQLRSPENQRDPEKYLKYVKRTISYMTQGIDVSSLFSELVIATNTQSMIQRKLVYLFLCNYADSNSELALLVVNTLQKDCHDSNPIVRGLALRSLSSLRIPSLAEYVFPVAKQLMADSSSYVRKISALAAAKISYLAPHLVEEYSIIPSLLHMLRDKDPLVVVGALTALEEIQADAGAPELSSAEVVQLLLARLPTFNEWGMHTVLTALARHFLPRNEDELFDVLNVIDGNLKHTNSGVVLACAKLFILYTENFPELHADVSTRLKDSLVTLMSANCPELIYIINQHLRMLMRRWPALMERDFRVFFLKYNESTFLRCQKIALLAQSATATNYGIIVDELSQYALDPKKSIVTAALNGLGKVATAVPAALDHCLGHLNSLSELEADATVVTMELLHVPQSGKVSVTLRAGPAALCFEDAPQTGIATGPVDYDQLLTTIVNDLTRAMQ